MLLILRIKIRRRFLKRLICLAPLFSSLHQFVPERQWVVSDMVVAATVLSTVSSSESDHWIGSAMSATRVWRRCSVCILMNFRQSERQRTRWRHDGFWSWFSSKFRCSHRHPLRLSWLLGIGPSSNHLEHHLSTRTANAILNLTQIIRVESIFFEIFIVISCTKTCLRNRIAVKKYTIDCSKELPIIPD